VLRYQYQFVGKIEAVMADMLTESKGESTISEMVRLPTFTGP